LLLVPLSKTSAKMRFEVFRQRYERASTLVTSNLPFAEWTELQEYGSSPLKPFTPSGAGGSISAVGTCALRPTPPLNIDHGLHVLPNAAPSHSF